VTKAPTIRKRGEEWWDIPGYAGVGKKEREERIRGEEREYRREQRK